MQLLLLYKAWQFGAGVASTEGSSAQVVAGASVPRKQKELEESSNFPKRVPEEWDISGASDSGCVSVSWAPGRGGTAC